MAVYCSRCSTANREGSRYCNNCGASMAAPAPLTCPQCQATVVSYGAYCHRCGASLPDPERPAVVAPEPITEMDTETESTVSEESEVISLSQVPLPGETAPSAEATVSLPVVAAETEPSPEPHTTPVEPAGVEDAAGRSIPEPLARQRPRPVRVRPSPSGASAAPVAPPIARGATSDKWQRLCYLTLAAAIVIGLLLPPGTLGSSTPPSAQVKALYGAIEALPPHANVLVSFDYEPATSDEMRPLAQAVISHLMQKKARLMVVSLLAQGPALAEAVVRPLAEQNIYSYGVDYVNLGFLPGDEAALATLSGDLRQVFTSDFVHARPLSEFTISRAITSVAAADLIVEISDDENGVRRWVEQVQSRSDVRLVAATSAAAMPLAFPYLQAGQVLGLASGLPAAAEYEYLLGETGPATRSMDAQSLGHLAILLFIAIGNIALLITRRRSGPQQTTAGTTLNTSQ